MVKTILRRVATTFWVLTITAVAALPIWGLVWVGYWGFTGQHITDIKGDQLWAIWGAFAGAFLLVAGATEIPWQIIDEKDRMKVRRRYL